MGQKEIIKKHASNFQTFIGTKQMERLVHESEETLQKLSKKGDMDKTEMEIKENNNVEETIFGIQFLGEIREIREKITLPMDREKPNRGQVMVETTFPKQLTLKHQFTLDDGYYTGCCTLPSGLIVFVDNEQKKVKILQSNGSLKSSVSFEGRGVKDVTIINDNHVAVSNSDSRIISIIDVDKGKVIKTLQTKSEVRGITHCNGHMYFCVPGNGIMKIQIESEKIYEVHNDKTVDYNSHIDTDGNRICYNWFSKETITVLDSDYRVIFTYRDQNIMEFPIDISMDQHQNMFVCNYYKKYLSLISREGDKHEVLVSKDNGLGKPLAVHYDKDKKEVLLVDKNCVARKFSVK